MGRRLIDADAFDKRIRLAVGSCEEELTEDFKDGISTILEMMKTAPTVDAVPVVRCKDCRWRKDKSGSTAWMPCRALVTPDNFSCVIGEREGGGDNG